MKTPNLRGRGDICLFVPQEVKHSGLPIFILLHGVYGSAWAWPLKGGAHRTANSMIVNGEIPPAIVAFPSDGLWGDGSAYFPHHGKNFEQWIAEDVPRAIRENIPQANEQSALCIGGLSMGGYGALLIGGRYPEKFSAISAHSSITALPYLAQFVEEPISAYQDAFYEKDVLETFIDNRAQLPPIRFDCGLDDPLLQANRELHLGLNLANIPHQYQEFSGAHEWSYWQEHVRKSFLFFAKALH